MEQPKVESKELAMPTQPLNAGSVPLRPFLPEDVKHAMLSKPVAPYGSPTITNAKFHSFAVEY